MQRANLVFVLLTSIPLELCAQNGRGSSCCERITPHVQAARMTLHEKNGPTRHEWLQAIVLWRAHSELSGSYPTEKAVEVERQTNAGRAASRERGREHLGGVRANGYHYADHDQQRLWVLDQEFALRRRDSALVVMVDGVDAPNGPTISGYAYIGAEMPENFWQKMWTSGDTMFIVRSRNAKGLLLQALRASPMVRTFLDGKPTR